MKVTILGSCTVIDFPQQIEKFFKGELLVDVRSGHPMEMDSLPIFQLAEMNNLGHLKERVCKGLLANLDGSDGQLWKCGMWGHDETHLRFTSVALRLMLLNTELFDKERVIRTLQHHLSHSESCLGGEWFYHDSIETNKQAYYPSWSGKPLLDTSQNNMLILNTHVDTLVTLLVAKKNKLELPDIDTLIEQGLISLNAFLENTQVVSGIAAWFDRLARNRLLNGLGNRDLVSRINVYFINRFYYRKVRYFLKKRVNLRGFSDGFWERDVRLTGPSLEYHVVNIWDMSRLVLWIKLNGLDDLYLSTQLLEAIESALKYCVNSKAYLGYLKRISRNKGVSNELLEAIAILFALGFGKEWMIALYMELRTYAPPSVGILGHDRTISGNLKSSLARPDNASEKIDWIPFEIGKVVVVNNGDTQYRFDDSRFYASAFSPPDKSRKQTSIFPKNIAVLSEK